MLHRIQPNANRRTALTTDGMIACPLADTNACRPVRESPTSYSRGVATQTQITMVDDIDGSTEDVLTCYLALGETAVEIDLSTANREELENFLARYIEAGRTVRPDKPARGRQAKSASKRTDRDQTAAVRAWAQENGYTVSARGRISREIQDAYHAAH